MAERNQKVYERVLQELGKNPNLGSKELFAIAQTVDKSVGRDTMQQFHARYYLPAKRELRPSEGGAAASQPRQARRGPGRRRARAEGTPAAQEGAAEESAQPRRRRLRRLQATQSGADRDRIRSVLLQFAQELTDAESRSNLVKVLGRVDSYVDRIADAVVR